MLKINNSSNKRKLIKLYYIGLYQKTIRSIYYTYTFRTTITYSNIYFIFIFYIVVIIYLYFISSKV